MTKEMQALADELLKANPKKSYRDMRDLLMEYGFEGIVAGEIARADGRN